MLFGLKLESVASERLPLGAGSHELASKITVHITAA